jgi:nucleoside-diphosphate-sugar epimerase
MKARILVLGATGGICYGLVKALLRKGVPTAILVRNLDRASDLFGGDPHLEVIKGDVQDSALLTRAAAGRAFIFHGVNASYERWETFMPAVTCNVIDAAERAKATVVFPGNVYNYGLIREPATEITPFRPTSSLGKVRVEIEDQLKRASDLGRIRTLIVRLPEVWGRTSRTS